MTRRFRRCGHTPGALTPEDQAVVDQFRAMLTAVRDPQPWTPGHGQDVAVRIGPFIERAHPRPGDDHGTEMIAVTLGPLPRPDRHHPRSPRPPAWPSDGAFVAEMPAWSRLDRSAGQKQALYVAAEKDTLRQQLTGWLEFAGIPVLVVRGFSSQSYADVVRDRVAHEQREAHFAVCRRIRLLRRVSLEVAEPKIAPR